MEVSRDTPIVDAPDQTPTERQHIGQESEVAPMVTEADVADVVAEELSDFVPPDIEHELPAQTSKGKGKVSEMEPRPHFQRGFVAAQGSALKDPEFTYALACSLQTLED